MKKNGAIQNEVYLLAVGKGGLSMGIQTGYGWMLTIHRA